MPLDWAFRNRSRALLICVVLLLPAAAPAENPTSIFDGQTLNGWDGDPAYWRVENGAIAGETKPGASPKQNTFLIWRGGAPGDFELQAEYRLTGGNSGIQYRSAELPDLRWGMKGYQADIDAAQQYTGQIYEERGRGFLALRVTLICHAERRTSGAEREARSESKHPYPWQSLSSRDTTPTPDRDNEDCGGR